MRKQIEQLISGLAPKSLTDGKSLGMTLRWKRLSRQYGMIQFEPGDLVRFGGFSNKYGTWICPMPNQSPSFEPFQVREKGDAFELIGHPILIGDVLDSIEHLERCNTSKIRDCVYFWRYVGFTKSLQEIFDCEWIERDAGWATINGWQSEMVQEPGDPAVKALGEFLLSLNLCKKS